MVRLSGVVNVAALSVCRKLVMPGLVIPQALPHELKMKMDEGDVALNVSPPVVTVLRGVLPFAVSESKVIVSILPERLVVSTTAAVAGPSLKMTRPEKIKATDKTRETATREARGSIISARTAEIPALTRSPAKPDIFASMMIIPFIGRNATCHQAKLRHGRNS
jgi:hypothetical protein